MRLGGAGSGSKAVGYGSCAGWDCCGGLHFRLFPGQVTLETVPTEADWLTACCDSKIDLVLECG